MSDRHPSTVDDSQGAQVQKRLEGVNVPANFPSELESRRGLDHSYVRESVSRVEHELPERIVGEFVCKGWHDAQRERGQLPAARRGARDPPYFGDAAEGEAVPNIGHVSDDGGGDALIHINGWTPRTLGSFLARVLLVTHGWRRGGAASCGSNGFLRRCF